MSPLLAPVLDLPQARRCSSHTCYGSPFHRQEGWVQPSSLPATSCSQSRHGAWMGVWSIPYYWGGDCALAEQAIVLSSHFHRKSSVQWLVGCCTGPVCIRVTNSTTSMPSLHVHVPALTLVKSLVWHVTSATHMHQQRARMYKTMCYELTCFSASNRELTTSFDTLVNTWQLCRAVPAIITVLSLLDSCHMSGTVLLLP